MIRGALSQTAFLNYCRQYTCKADVTFLCAAVTIDWMFALPISARLQPMQRTLRGCNETSIHRYRIDYRVAAACRLADGPRASSETTARYVVAGHGRADCRAGAQRRLRRCNRHYTRPVITLTAEMAPGGAAQ